MLVKALRQATFGACTYEKGEVADLPDGVGRRWINRGLGEAVPDPSATAPPAESVNLDLAPIKVLRKLARDRGVDPTGMSHVRLVDLLREPEPAVLADIEPVTVTEAPVVAEDDDEGAFGA